MTNMNECMQLSLISVERQQYLDFSLMTAILDQHLLDTSDNFKNYFIMILDPQNMGLDTLIVDLCALLTEIWRNILPPVMA